MEEFPVRVAGNEAIRAVTFNRHAQPQLLAFGSDSLLSIATVDAANGPGAPAILSTHDIHHGTRIADIQWAYNRDGNRLDLRLATAGADRNVRVIDSTLDGQTTHRVLRGHTNYVNSVAFDPRNDETVASCGDDVTCRLWDVRAGQQTRLIRLNTAGVYVSWHADDTNHSRILIAERGGLMKFYDLRATMQAPILTFAAATAPLTCAEWNPSDQTRLGCVAGGKWYAWTIGELRPAAESGESHKDNTTVFKWSNIDGHFSTASHTGQIRVTSLQHHLMPTTLTQRDRIGGLSWHRDLPMFVTGGVGQLIFWRRTERR